MDSAIKKSTTLRLLFWGMLFSLLPVMSWAAIAVQTHAASGNIIQIEENGAIKLDNSKLYHPSRKGLVNDLQVNQSITLRYVVENGEKNVFFEYAPGLNSLEEGASVPSRTGNK